MKRLLKKMSGRSKGSEAFADAPSSAREAPAQPSVPPAYIPQHPVVSNGSMRRPRRPRETLDLSSSFSAYAPFAPPEQQQQQQPAALLATQEEADAQLAWELARQEVEATTPHHPPSPLAPVPVPVPAPESVYAPEPTPAQDARQAEEDAYQAELDRVMRESVLQADYDNVLRDIKLWVLDLRGVLGDVEDAQAAARARRGELEAQMAAASAQDFDEDGWQQLVWLSERQADVEARLADLGWRLKPISDAIQALAALDAYIREDQPPVSEARSALDRIIAELLEALNVMGFAFHHPTGPWGRQPGEGSSKDGEGARHTDPLRELVHSLIQETQRVPPPPPSPPKTAPPLPPPPPREEEPAVTAVPEPEPCVPATPEPSVESPPPRPTQPAPEPSSAPSLQLPPPAPPSDSGSARGSQSARSGGGSKPSTARTATPRLEQRAQQRKRSSGVRPKPDDTIKRLPRVVALYHELQKGVVAEAIGWRHARPETAASRATAAALDSEDEPSPTMPLSAGEVAQCAAEVAAFRPASIQEAADFAEEMRARGVGSGGGAAAAGGAQQGAGGWPQAKWSTLLEAGKVYDSLRGMVSELCQWRVDEQAGTVAESARLAAFMDRLAQQAGRVMYPHDPLRQRMAKHGVPWDESVVTEARWAAQTAAAALMTHALEEAKERSKSKKWQSSLVLQPLAYAAMGAFKVHQFCGGLNAACTALFDSLQEITVHHARMMDHHWLRNTKWA